MRPSLCFIGFAMLLLALLPAAALAQTPPTVDAGSLRQQLESGIKPAAAPAASALDTQPAAPLNLPQGVVVQVQAFGFEGNTLLPDAALAAAVQPYVGRTLGFADLQRAAQAVADTYRQAGWVVRTLLPAQDVSHGRVTIHIVEARFAGTRLVGEGSGRVAPQVVLGFVEAQQREGDPVSVAALDRALLLADDLPGVALRGALEPAGSDRGTRLALTASDEALLSGEATIDNLGARATGAGRLIAAGRLASPMGLGDRAQGLAVRSRGSHFVRLAYDLPLGSQGLRVGAMLTDFGYRVVASEFAALDARGDSRGFGLEASYPLLRSRKLNASLTLSHQRDHLRNNAIGLPLSDYHYSATAVGLSVQGSDEQGATTAFSLAWLGGRKALGSLQMGENPKAQGRETVLRMSAWREQPLTSHLALYASLAGQWAGSDVDSSQRMVLGGPSGVRAYPVSEAAGSRGRLFSAELRWRPRSEATAAVFVDAGQVGDGPGGMRRTTLKGAGLSLTWVDERGVTLRAAWAHRIGRNPNAGPSGTDQDGSLQRNRLWLQLTCFL